MKAFVNQQLVEYPDHARHDVRVLVRAHLVGCHEAPRQSHLTLGRTFSMVMDRLDQIFVTFAHDGVRALAQKATHILRRERMELDHQFTSFVGEVVEDKTDQPLRSGTRVTGFSLTHPAASEFVLTRREHLWPIASEIPATMAALSLFGGCAISAIREAKQQGNGPVSVLGHGLLASTIAVLLEDDGLDACMVGRDQDARAEIPVCIVAGSHPMKFSGRIKSLIGCGWREDELRRRFPGAETY